MNNEESFSTKHKRMQREMVKQAYIWGIEMGVESELNSTFYDHNWHGELNHLEENDLQALYIKLGIEE